MQRLEALKAMQDVIRDEIDEHSKDVDYDNPRYRKDVDYKNPR